MNPGALILIALLANNNNSRSVSSLSLPNSFRFDNVLGHLQTAVETMEKVQQLSRIGSTFNSHSLPPPSHSATPVEPISAEVVEHAPEPESQSQPDLSSLLQNIDLPSAMQTIGPLLSMLNPK